MLILLGEYGFCSGVKRAINIALDESKKRKKRKIYTNNKLIHNNIVVKNLEENNIFALTEGQQLQKGDTLIISAHGCGEKYITDMAEQGIEIIDTTCPFVKKIHEKVKEFSQNENSNVIIVGDENHIEVKGIANRCKSYQIVNNFEEINFDCADNFLIVAQTTFSNILYTEIIQKIANYINNLTKRVEFFNSICYTTLCRQNQCESIAKEADTVIVVGDKNSSNCIKLYNLAKSHCDNVILIENGLELNSIHINKNIAKLGILSSASTPKELTMEVFNRMSETNNLDTLAKEEINTEMPVIETETTEAEIKPEAEKKAKAEPTMHELMKEYSPKQYKVGKKVKVSVISADASGINVAIIDGNGKNDYGFISKEEAEIDGSYDAENYPAETIIEACFIPKTSDKSKAINLSKSKADQIKIDDEKVKTILAGEEFKLVCNQAINGGLLGRIGSYTVFVPASQIRLGYVKNLEEYTNKELRLKMLPPKEEIDEEGNVKKSHNSRRIVASQRIILEQEKIEREEKFWSKIYEGAIVTGKVKRFADFGAFVSLKYMDALVHNSDLSWSKKRINNPGEVLEINKTYEFIILSADRENGKISLGYKQLQKKPYEIAQEKYPVGTIITGKVARVVSFGAFVELEPGIDGLVHVSQIKHGWIQSATEALKEGDEVTVKVMNYENEKITLSIKELLPIEESFDSEVQEQEQQAPEKSSKLAAFNKRLEAQQEKTPKTRRTRKDKEDGNDEPREYSSSNSGVTLGDLFNLKQ